MGREVGGGFWMGNTCALVTDSCRCMAKTTTILQSNQPPIKINKLILKNRESWRRKWQPTPVLLPKESHGRRSLVSRCLWGCTELDVTEVT